MIWRCVWCFQYHIKDGRQNDCRCLFPGHRLCFWSAGHVMQVELIFPVHVVSYHIHLKVLYKGFADLWAPFHVDVKSFAILLTMQRCSTGRWITWAYVSNLSQGIASNRWDMFSLIYLKASLFTLVWLHCIFNMTHACLALSYGLLT